MADSDRDQLKQTALLGDDLTPERTRRPPKDGLTAKERAEPYPTDPELLKLEEQAARTVPDQLELLLPTGDGQAAQMLSGLPLLTEKSSLDLARSWYRRELEQHRRPENTIESYCYDLMKLEERIGAKPINRITRADIAEFLGLANNRATRKRRLTSVRRFFRYLIDDARVINADPTEGFFPHSIQLRAPVPLFAAEQDRLLDAAAADEPWSLPAVWLMMRLGLGRGELLALRREHIDLADPDQPVVYVFYDDVAKRSKERKLAGDREFAKIYAAYLADREPPDLLFPFGFQAVNGMVERLRKVADIKKEVSPQTLRHTFAVDRAKAGAGEEQLLELLGLADDLRNRESVRRYLKLAEPPL
jgi:integrase/recombinase XerD